MNRRPVASSNLASVGYDERSRRLEIEFHRGGIYQYFDVPKHIYSALMQAASKGKYFHHAIKGVFRYVRL